MENKKYLSSDSISLESCDLNYITIISEVEYKNYSYFQSKFEQFDIGVYEGDDYYKPVDISSENFKEISEEEYETFDKLICLWEFDYDFFSEISNKINEFCEAEDIDYETPNVYLWDLPEEEFRKSLDDFISKFKEKFGNYCEYYCKEDLYVIQLT